jgi:hypothetical protein
MTACDTIFDLNEYEYDRCSATIKADKGDIVKGDILIDAGGCWGDTALCFANEVATDGKSDLCICTS